MLSNMDNQATLTAKDVTNVENSRMLKRNGVLQDGQAYWQGIMPSLSTIQGMASIASEQKGKMRWNLVLSTPPEPSARAFTLEELKDYLTLFMEAHNIERELPPVTQSGKNYLCTVDEKHAYTELTEVDAFALAVLYYIKGV